MAMFECPPSDGDLGMVSKHGVGLITSNMSLMCIYTHTICIYIYMEVSINGGIPKWMVYNGFADSIYLSIYLLVGG